MDLLSSRPFWPIRDGLPTTFPPLAAHADCDLAIIGGGISGALTAWHLVDAGFDAFLKGDYGFAKEGRIAFFNFCSNDNP
jgi:hypothetical protein